jgi:hypothetical protein
MKTLVDNISAKIGEENVVAVNPGDWFGEPVWILSIPLGNFSVSYAVEADCEQDAIDSFVDSKFGHLITIEDKDIEEIPMDERSFGGNNSKCIDLSEVQLHEAPKSLKYFGNYEGRELPADGLTPLEFYEFINESL